MTPPKGYDSVNLPSGLYARIKELVKNRAELGYRSVTEFVSDATRRRAEQVDGFNEHTAESD